jgi:two-component system chemotaxis response regulator CheB
MSKSAIKVLVVDDSALMRKIVSDILSSVPDIRVVGQARDGVEALAMVRDLRPDVVTLDVEMPRLNGFQTLQQIMAQRPVPVVMLSALTMSGAAATLDCLEAGALDFVAKPSGNISLDMKSLATELIEKVRTGAKARVHSALENLRVEPKSTPVVATSSVQPRLVIIGASTGGPQALQQIVPAIPRDLNAAFILVQHMPPKFTTSFASRLDQLSAISVCEAKAGDEMRPGVALLAPGGTHLLFDDNDRVVLGNGPTVHGVRPSVDITIESLVQRHGDKMMAVLLTGMGCDGARGLKTVHDAGGSTIAEDSSTCVVYGMPRAAVALGAADRILPLHQIARAIVDAVQSQAKDTRQSEAIPA